MPPSSRQKRGSGIGKTKIGKGVKVMALSEGRGLPIAFFVEGAGPHESQGVERLIEGRFLKVPLFIILGDKAYDSDALDQRLKEKGIRLITPHSKSRKKRTQDRRGLRRYRRRYKIERLFAWMKNFGRLRIRYETKLENFQAFVHLAAILILIKNYL